MPSIKLYPWSFRSGWLIWATCSSTWSQPTVFHDTLQSRTFDWKCQGLNFPCIAQPLALWLREKAYGPTDWQVCKYPPPPSPPHGLGDGSPGLAIWYELSLWEAPISSMRTRAMALKCKGLWAGVGAATHTLAMHRLGDIAHKSHVRFRMG